ncbi:MAG: hypothetical protein KC616_15035 [Myxococcales bacterium]|nr:hypothetical protein [Myxococcales bacterium]
MTPPRTRPGLRSILHLSLLVAWLAGCAGSGPPPVVTDGGGLVLAEDEGLFVVHVDSEVPIERLLLSDREIASNLPIGRHLFVVRLPAGSYEWTRIELRGDDGRLVLHDPRRIDLENDREFEVEIRAGHLSYAGELLVAKILASGSYGWMSLRNRNHSAMAVRSLLETSPDLIDRFPLHYGGSSGDGFLEHYSRERRRVRAASGDGSEG